jgi:hypothetical protein
VFVMGLRKPVESQRLVVSSFLCKRSC